MTKNNTKKPTSLKIPWYITFTFKILYFFSKKLALKLALKLFTTPIKHKIPNRELEMDKNSNQNLMKVPALNKEIMVYNYGVSAKKILLVHGWSGRGTQLYKIADEMIINDYSTISFDAPAHGKSGSKSSLMLEFMECVLELNKQQGPFEFAVCHSLGAMATINALNKGLFLKKVVFIGSADSIMDIFLDFVSKIKMPNKLAFVMKDSFEKKYHIPLETYSTGFAAETIETPVLIIHDKNDLEVPVDCSIKVAKKLKNSELFLTENLGHRKILGDKKVIDKIVDYLLIKK